MDTMKALTNELNSMGRNSEAMLEVMQSRSQSDEQLTALISSMIERSQNEQNQTVELLADVKTSLHNIDIHANDNSLKVIDELKAVQTGLLGLEKDTADDNAIIIRELSQTLGTAIETTHSEMKEHLSELHNTTSDVTKEQLELLSTIQSLQGNSNETLEHIHTSSEHNRELLQSLEEHQQISQSALTRQTSAMTSLGEMMQTTQNSEVSKQRLIKQIGGEISSVKREISKSNQKELHDISEALESLKSVQQRQASSARELLTVQQGIQTTSQRESRTFEELISSQGEKQTTYLQMINETMIESQQTLEDISQGSVETSEKQNTYLQMINETMIESQQTLEDISNQTPAEKSTSSKAKKDGFFNKLFK